MWHVPNLMKGEILHFEINALQGSLLNLPFNKNCNTIASAFFMEEKYSHIVNIGDWKWLLCTTLWWPCGMLKWNLSDIMYEANLCLIKQRQRYMYLLRYFFSFFSIKCILLILVSLAISGHIWTSTLSTWSFWSTCHNSNF